MFYTRRWTEKSDKIIAVQWKGKETSELKRVFFCRYNIVKKLLFGKYRNVMYVHQEFGQQFIFKGYWLVKECGIEHIYQWRNGDYVFTSTPQPLPDMSHIPFESKISSPVHNDTPDTIPRHPKFYSNWLFRLLFKKVK